MKKASKYCLLIVSYLIIFSFGVMGGGWYSWKTVKQADALLGHAAILSRYSMHVEMQRAHGSDKDYRDALLAFSEALDLARFPESPLYSDTIYYTDKSLIYVRLSELEDKIGNAEQTEKYMGLAVDYCEKVGWEDCTPERLTWISDRLNAESIFNAADK
jgi:hypothetical protein